MLHHLLHPPYVFPGREHQGCEGAPGVVDRLVLQARPLQPRCPGGFPEGLLDHRQQVDVPVGALGFGTTGS